MIAISLLTVGVFALSAEMGVLMGRQIRATSEGEITSLGESKLEELRSYAMIESANKAQVTVGGSVTADVADHNDVATGPSGRQYTRRWLVAAGPGGTRTVALRVSPTAANVRHVPMATDFNTLIMVIE
jgi:hypothetical protein